MAVPRIFLSYSHKDEYWKDRLLAHLRVLERTGRIDVWDTGSLQAGSDWSGEIIKALKEAKIAILLISPDFLASDFIVERELAAILNRRQKEGLVVLSILIYYSLWAEIPELAQIQFLNNPQQPLAALSEQEADKALALIARQIVDLAEAFYQQEVGAKASTKKPKRSTKGSVKDVTSSGETEQQVFISHSNLDGDFAELLKLKLEREGYDAWIDVDRLGPGVDWRLEIDEAIKKSLIVIAVMSPEARASEYVTYEWAFAWGTGVKVVPIMLRQTALHPRLATLQFLDFSNRIARPWTKLLEALDDAKNGKARKK